MTKNQKRKENNMLDKWLTYKEFKLIKKLDKVLIKNGRLEDIYGWEVIKYDK